jgi:eukaryotic-like serine/threonine-protein kinase
MTNATTTEFSRRCRHCGEPLDPASSFCSKCGATADAPGTSGDSLRDSVQALFGRELEMQDELGRGGMAAVYAAFDPALQRRVAVKVLLPELAAETGMSEKFLQEARTVASLQHPHVVTVYGVRASDTAQAIVMQFVEGRSLDTVLKGKSRLPIPVAGLILAQAASGLQHAHDRGIVHRDVKPANVLLDHDGRAIVSDFGIARRETAPRTTATGFVIGTWSYMSPEQRSAQAVGPATDQYAFGVMAFEILTGELPFKGNVQEVLHAHMVEAPPSLRERRPEIPASIEALVHRMLAKQPNERYSSLRDAERAFRALVPDEGGTTQVIAAYSHVQKASGSAVIAATKIPNVPGLVRNSLTASSAPTVPSQRVAPTATAAGNSRSGWIAAAAGVVLLVGVGIVWKMKSGTPEATPLAQTTPRPAPASSVPAGEPGREPAGGDAAAQSAAANTSPNRVDKQPVAISPSGPGAAAPAAAAPVTASPGNASAATVAPSPAVTAPPRVDSSSTRAVTNASAAPDAASSVPAAAVADARKIGRDFVTMLNQHRFRELAQLSARGGDATLRAELIRLTQNAPDFEAGFDRVASAPERTADGFVTDFILDLQWKGGQKQLVVQTYATMQSGTWHLAGFGVEATR